MPYLRNSNMNLKVKTHSFFIVGITLLFCTSCGSSKKEASQTTGGAGLPEFVTESRYVTALLNGQSALLRNDFATAQKAFSSCLLIKPNDAEALFRLSQTERKIGNNNVATDLAAKACEYNQQHVYWYNLHYSELLDNKGDFEQSALIIQEALTKNPEVEFLYTKSDSAWQRIEEYKKAEKVWDLYKVNFPTKTFFADYQLVGIYEKQNKKSDALTLSKKLFDNDPYNGKYVSKYLLLLEDRKEIEKILFSYLPLNIKVNYKKEFYENAYFQSHKLNIPSLTLSYAVLSLSNKEQTNSELATHFEGLLHGLFFRDIEIASEVKTIAENNPQNALLQYLTATQFLKELKVEESFPFFENCVNLRFSRYDFYTNYAYALLLGGRIQALTEHTLEAVQTFPLSTHLKYYRALSLVGKPGFEDWMDEILPFIIDVSDKLFFGKMKTLHQVRIEKKIIGNDFFEGIAQLNAMSKDLLLYAVFLSGNTTLDKASMDKYSDGAYPSSLLLESLWLLNNKQAAKAVEMLKNKEVSLSTIPLFCKLYALALLESRQIKEAKFWNQKAIDAKLDKDLLQHINNGKEF